MRNTSVSLLQTTTKFDSVCLQCKNKCVSASWCVAFKLVRLASDLLLQRTAAASSKPSDVTTYCCCSGALSISVWNKSLGRSGLFPGSERNPCQSSDSGTFGFSIYLLMGFSFFLLSMVASLWWVYCIDQTLHQYAWNNDYKQELHSSTFRYSIGGFVTFQIKKQLQGHQQAKLISKYSSTDGIYFAEFFHQKSEKIFGRSLIDCHSFLPKWMALG